MTKKRARKPDYRKLFYWAIEQALLWNHGEICGSQCSCQEYEEGLYRSLKEEWGYDPRESER